MLEIKSIKKSVPEASVDEIAFGNGINHLTDSSLYNIISKCQFPTETETFINGQDTPINKITTKSFCVVNIKSDAFSIYLVFFVDNEKKKEFMKSFQDELHNAIAKDIAPSEKLKILFNICKTKDEIAYISFDPMHESNIQFKKNLLDSCLNFADSLCFIAFDNVPVPSLELTIDTAAEEMKAQEVAAIKAKEKAENTINKNDLYYLLFTFIFAFSSFFSFLLCPFILSGENVSTGVIFAIIGSIILVVELFVIFSSYSHYAKNNNEKTMVFFYLRCVIIGFIFALLVMLILTSCNVIITFTNLSFIHFVPALVILFVMLLITLFVKRITSISLKVWDFIKTKILKMDKKEK